MRHALVTGGSRGIGASVALGLAKCGVTVTVAGRTDSTALHETLARLQSAAPGEHSAEVIDVSQPLQVDEGLQRMLGRVSRIDVLVNAAGVSHDGLMLRRPSDQAITETISTNLAGPMYTSRVVAKAMARQRSGVIINIGSVVGCSGNVGQAVYSASKAGLVGLTRSLAKELGPFGVRSNLIAPGYIATDMTQGLTEQLKGEIEGKIPAGRFGRPEDVAALACFLASPAADYINGQVIGVDGGLRL